MPPGKLGLYSLDEIPADAPASRALRDDQFAQVCPEAQVVGTDKARDRGAVLPDQAREVDLGVPNSGSTTAVALIAARKW